MSKPIDIDKCVFFTAVLKAVLENLKKGQTVTTLYSAKGKYELELTLTKIGDKRLPKARRPS